MGVLRMILAFLKAVFVSRAKLSAENVMLRQQLIVVHRSVPCLKFGQTDRIVLCWLSRLWSGWRSALLIVQPDTLTRWHRQGFKLYWRRKSRKKPGRPLADLPEEPRRPDRGHRLLHRADDHLPGAVRLRDPPA